MERYDCRVWYLKLIAYPQNTGCFLKRSPKMTKVKNGGASGEGVRINSMLSDTHKLGNPVDDKSATAQIEFNGLLELFDLG